MSSQLSHPTAPLQAQDLFHALPDLAFRLDPQGLILEVNAAAEAAAGAAPVGQRLQESLPPAVADRLAQALAQIASERCVLSFDYTGAGAAGETHHETRLVPLPAGQVLALIRDVTELRQSEHALRESDAKFRHLADNVTDAFWIRSADMREVHYVSPGFERIWGRPMHTLYGSPARWVDYIVPEDRERVVETFAGLASGGHSLDIEYRITRPDGEVRWIRARGFPVRDAQGVLIRHTGIITDVTDRKHAEQQLAATQAQLLEASRRAGMAEIDGRAHV